MDLVTAAAKIHDMTSMRAFIYLAFAGLAAGSNFYYHHPVAQFYVSNTPVVVQTVGQLVPEGQKTAGLTCKAAGFFTHPTICGRFYRCVDFTRSGVLFSIYESVCPEGTVFVAGDQNTCVPGDCQGESQVIAQQVEDTVVTQSESGDVTPVQSEDKIKVTEVRVDLNEQTASGGETSNDVAQESVDGVATVDDGAATVNDKLATDEDKAASACATKFIQHSKYCNIYYSCPDDEKRYMCDLDSAFNEELQICDLRTQGSICKGKELIGKRYLARAGLSISPGFLPVLISSSGIINKQLMTSNKGMYDPTLYWNQHPSKKTAVVYNHQEAHPVHYYSYFG